MAFHDESGAAAGVPVPPADCPLCPRLAAFRAGNRQSFPDFFNAPVPSFGEVGGRLLVIGMAPGLRGANRTGRPFTGDYAGDLLYATLLKFGFAEGTYLRDPDDGLKLVDCRITNAARCVPPQNKLEPAETSTCRRFLAGELAAMPNLRAVVVLGKDSHDSAVRAFGGKPSRMPFGHGVEHELKPGVRLFASYHCSRYNTNTGRLTTAMFEDVFTAVRRYLG